MEGQGSFRAGVAADDLARLVKADGPFLSLYLPLDPDVESAARRSEAEWKSVRQELEDAGPPARVLDRISELIPEAHQHGRCLAVVGTGTDLLHVEHGPLAPPSPRATWAPLPQLAPIIEWRQLQPPHLLVLADRTGADLVAFVGEEGLDRRTARGERDHPISKTAPGGWSQRRFQERAENTWEDNAEAVIPELSRMAEEYGVPLIVAAGDVRALELLEHELPDRLRPLFVTIPGARNAGANREAIEAEARRQVRVLVDQETARTLARFQEEVGQRDLAVQGKDNTLEALSRAQVETLLVYDHPEDDRPAFCTSEPIPVAATEARLEEIGVEPRIEGRLIDVVIRAAIGTGAGVRIIPAESGVADNVGALLRWTT